MTRLTLWTRDDGKDAAPRSFADAVPLRAAGGLAPAGDERLADSANRGGARAPLLVPGRGSAPAVLLVPDELARRPSINGTPTSGGMHLLAHGDRVELGETTVWLSTDSGAEETTYDPALHGDEIFCFRTKARLVAGDAIVICPGTERAACGMVFKASAWALGTVCHNCRYDPKAPRWTPPAARERISLDALFALLEE